MKTCKLSLTLSWLLSLLSVLLTGTPDRSRYSYSVDKLLLDGLFLRLSIIYWTYYMYIYKYMYFFKCANVSKFFFFKPSILWNLIKNVFGLWIFHKFPFFNLNIWLYSSKIWLIWCIIRQSLDQNRKYNKTLVITAKLLFWCQ